MELIDAKTAGVGTEKLIPTEKQSFTGGLNF